MKLGRIFFIRIVVSNPNTIPINNIQLTDTLQPNITVTSDVDGLFAGNVTIANGASAEAQYTYTIVNASTVNNVACVDSEIGTFCSTSIATTYYST